MVNDLKLTAKKVIILALAVIAVVVALNSFYVVEEDEHACKVRFSEIIDTKSKPGIYFKVPFLDSVKTFPKATMLYDILPSEVFTSDKQNMTVDCYVLWRISDPKLFYRSLGSTTVAEDRMNALTYTELKNVMSTLAQSDIINMEDGSKRNEIYDGISRKVSQQATAYGIEITDVKIKQFDLPASNLNAVYARMISERNQKAEMYTANGKYDASIIRNDVDKQVNILISNAEANAAKLVAEGEAEYMRLLAAAYNDPEKKDFYEFTLALDALEKSLQGGEKTIILDADSPLAKILTGALENGD